MLTVENMSSFLKGLAISHLPKVFQDAIDVARELGLSYIWIDALCIIQRGDGNKDWLVESGRMTSVYGNSFVNLAALSAANVHQSLFSKPDHYNDGFCARVSTSKYSTVRRFQSSSAGEVPITASHLATRAWTLQERLLPARTIYIGNTGVLWECRSASKSEFLPDGITRFYGSSSLRLLVYEGWNWCEIVAQYSCAHLTNAADRLPALAGVARRQHEVTGHHYLAGLWREILIPNLTWSVSGERRKRPAWRAPSWSWMSVDSEACYCQWGFWFPTVAMNNEKKYISVQDAWTTPSGPDPFGQVSGGLLSIKCSALVQAELLDSGRSAKALPDKSSAGPRFVRLKPATPRFPISMDVLEDEGESSEVYLMPVFGGAPGLCREKPGMSHLQITGLVLQACGEGTDNRGRFSRVGSFNFENFEVISRDDNAWDRDYYREFIEFLDAARPERAEAEHPHASSSHDHSRDWISITIE